MADALSTGKLVKLVLQTLSNPPLLKMLAFFLGSALYVEVGLEAKKETTRNDDDMLDKVSSHSSGFGLQDMFQISHKRKIEVYVIKS